MTDGRLVRTTTVAGQEYKVYINAGQTMKWATNTETNETKVIYKGGSHFSTDLATRKAISYAFQTGTFRK